MKLQASVYLQNYIKKTLKNITLDNSELHYTSETIIRILLLQNVLNTNKVQLQTGLDNILKIDEDRG